MIFYKILKFHDISMTGKAPIIFQGFPGFPGAVGTLLLWSWNTLPDNLTILTILTWLWFPEVFLQAEYHEQLDKEGKALVYVRDGGTKKYCRGSGHRSRYSWYIIIHVGPYCSCDVAFIGRNWSERSCLAAK